MKTRLFFIILFIQSTFSFAQIDPCKGEKSGTYFPLNIETKKIMWTNVSYSETLIKEDIKNNKKYKVYAQKWSVGTTDTLRLREENGKVFQYNEKTGSEYLRYDPSLTVGDKWKPKHSFKKFEVISNDGKLKTPYCNYINLLVIRGTYSDKSSYDFYYLKGYGYVGATTAKGDDLISFIIDE
ncbi:MAG: hypothetical protein ACPGTP_09900 [Bacteroidia bacterium]